MIELLLHKHSFTILIVCLYVMQSVYQALIHKDFVFGWYWVSAASITIASMMLSNR